jgi:hypothetical protein
MSSAAAEAAVLTSATMRPASCLRVFLAAPDPTPRAGSRCPRSSCQVAVAARAPGSAGPGIRRPAPPPRRRPPPTYSRCRGGPAHRLFIQAALASCAITAAEPQGNSSIALRSDLATSAGIARFAQSMNLAANSLSPPKAGRRFGARPVRGTDDSEREVLLASAPHIVRPLRFVLPYARGLRPRTPAHHALWAAL